MKRNSYILIAMLLVWLTPHSMQAFGTTPTSNFTTDKTTVAGCAGVTVTGGNSNIVVAGLGAYSHILVFTPGFASTVFDQETGAATLTIPIATAGDYIVKVWSNPDPSAPCENNFNVTVGGGGGGASVLTLNGCTNASATAAAGATTAIVNYTAPTATTTCAAGGATVTRTSGGASGTAFPIGSSQVCFSATDACGNTQTCCITVTVTGSTGGGGGNVCTDPAANIIGGSGSITINGITSSCAIVQVFNSSWSSVYNQQVTGSSVTVPNLAPGSYIVKVSVLGAGCTWPSTCDVQLTVTVGGSPVDPCATDAIAPVFAGCPSNIALTTTGTCANATWTAPTATDNCGTPTVTQLLGGAIGSCFPVGTTMVKYMAKDAKGNFSTCIFNVVVTQTVVDPCATDAIAPVLVGCPANIIKTPTSAGTCWTVSWTAPTATDNCGTPSVSQTAGPANGSCVAPGTYTVTYKATDAKGNSSTCSFTVTVNAFSACANDATAPVFAGCPANIVKVPTSAGTCWTISWTAPTATDNCSTPSVSQTAGPSNGSCIAPGTYTVTYKATDAKGNSAICSFTITVNAYANPCATDATPPTITCPPHMSKVPTNGGTCWTNITWNAATATDNCSTPTVTQIAGPASGSCIGYGVSTVTYKATDAKGNSATCSFTVTITPPPVCNAPSTPYGWMYLGVNGTSHYFKWTGSGDLNHASAKSKAASIGGRLPVIKSAAQNAFIQSKLGGGNCWIGIRRSGYNWLWDNNAPSTYFNWAAGEPNNYNGNEGNAAMYGSNGQWNDTNCDNYNWCVAEIPCGGLGVYLAANDQLSFGAASEVNRTRLEWTNNTGYKNDFFTVEKANATSGNFDKLEVVNNKYSSDINEYYTVYDNAPTEGDNVYRVTVNYVDGTSKTSATQTINYKGSEGIRLYPNPAVETVGVDLSKYKGQAVTIALYNQFGQQVLTQQIEKATGSVNLDISQNTAGNYLIRVISKGRKDVIQQLHIAK